MSAGTRRAAAGKISTGGAPAFGPVTGVGWTAAWWAGGTEFAALGLSDGAAVTTWPDEKSTYDMAQGTAGAKPTYRAVGGANSKPAVEFDGGDILTRASTPFTPTESYPCSTVAIAKSDYVGADQKMLFGTEGAVGGLWQQDTKWTIYAGTQLLTAAIANTSWHLFVAYWNGASSKLDIDGTQVASGAAGNNGQTGMGAGGFAGGSGSWDGFASFFGRCAGDVRTDPGWTSFKTWVTSEYGITVA